MEDDRWLRRTASCFEGCKRELDERGAVTLETYVEALSSIPAVFAFLGSVFGFAKKDLDGKLEHLAVCCRERDEGVTVKEAIEADHSAGRELAGRDPGAVSRPLHRVTNSLKFLNLLLEVPEGVTHTRARTRKHTHALSQTF